MTPQTIKLVNKSSNPDPEFAIGLASGFDLRAWIDNNEGSVTLQPHQRMLIHTGIHLGLPFGVEAQVRSRSGMTLKVGLVVANSPATIDSDYTGEIGVIAYNIGNDKGVVPNYHSL